MLISALDVIIWHGVASVLVPGFVLFHFTKLMKGIFGDIDGMPGVAKDWGAVAVSFGLLAFMSVPLDGLANTLLDSTIRTAE
ncbi:mitochondrial fission process protein 1-like [Aplysia californica]|uniref:Mitochondrial fission process protein 1-like n=1 Tax=Aplysia californica TaxID=6500 RepID=A0ABM0JEY0_APLCA|nr:mitochondrial fission process protein 1-like [Aplysia californica]